MILPKGIWRLYEKNPAELWFHSSHSVFAGPDEVLVTSEWLSQNPENPKVRIVEVIAESFVFSFTFDQFKPSIPELPWLKASVSFSGGIFLGWCACVSVGCTFGNFFPGISEGSLSGFVFALGLIPGILLGSYPLNPKRRS
ncbi:hypothetical protein A0128_04820 [Leptospira tipperaryensis]|uniref:Uncharacterized protein n=1 Tax=Leptospira tipperaryensis TaxID=2564040 RepID=A0A1D7UUE7_9LEPT|nr:YeeE/YedE thiosulfate transporter family protein [Leptospira tipperaryensis]AOP33230.1 hypothetical protein A0128_04820 [Leptospira tipperaryensis]